MICHFAFARSRFVDSPCEKVYREQQQVNDSQTISFIHTTLNTSRSKRGFPAFVHLCIHCGIRCFDALKLALSRETVN